MYAAYLNTCCVSCIRQYLDWAMDNSLIKRSAGIDREQSRVGQSPVEETDPRATARLNGWMTLLFTLFWAGLVARSEQPVQRKLWPGTVPDWQMRNLCKQLLWPTLLASLKGMVPLES